MHIIALERAGLNYEDLRSHTRDVFAELTECKHKIEDLEDKLATEILEKNQAIKDMH